METSPELGGVVCGAQFLLFSSSNYYAKGEIEMNIQVILKTDYGELSYDSSPTYLVDVPNNPPRQIDFVNGALTIEGLNIEELSYLRCGSRVNLPLSTVGDFEEHMLNSVHCLKKEDIERMVSQFELTKDYSNDFTIRVFPDKLSEPTWVFTGGFKEFDIDANKLEFDTSAVISKKVSVFALSVSTIGCKPKTYELELEVEVEVELSNGEIYCVEGGTSWKYTEETRNLLISALYEMCDMLKRIFDGKMSDYMLIRSMFKNNSGGN